MWQTLDGGSGWTTMTMSVYIYILHIYLLGIQIDVTQSMVSYIIYIYIAFASRRRIFWVYIGHWAPEPSISVVY